MYQKFIDLADNSSNEDDKDKVDMLLELVNSLKSNLEGGAA